jgi:hypothetical protein
LQLVNRPKTAAIAGPACGRNRPRGPAESSAECSPRSSAEIALTSSLDKAKSKMSILAAIRSGLVDFGTALRPSSMCQRSTTWAAVLAWRAAISVIVGSRSSWPPRAIGLHDCVTMPWRWW